MRIETKITDITYDSITGMTHFGDALLLSDKKAVDAARQNIASQADSDYMDGEVHFIIDGDVFFEGETTALTWLWLDLISFQERFIHDVAEITFLDSQVSFFIVEKEEGYQLQYGKTHFTFNEENIVIHSEERRMESQLINKETFIRAIEEGFIEYREFIVKNQLPISKWQWQDLLTKKITER